MVISSRRHGILLTQNPFLRGTTNRETTFFAWFGGRFAVRVRGRGFAATARGGSPLRAHGQRADRGRIVPAPAAHVQVPTGIPEDGLDGDGDFARHVSVAC